VFDAYRAGGLARLKLTVTAEVTVDLRPGEAALLRFLRDASPA
jgi:hypothetical protein